MNETTGGVPGWLTPLVTRATAATGRDFTRMAAPAGVTGRASAVLVLFGEGEHGPDVLMLERAADMRNHAGQPAFPGGAADPGDADAVATALREANEEVGLDPASVDVLAVLPQLWIPISRFLVTPVLAWWRKPHPVHAVQAAEVAHVARLPVAELVDPAHRLQVRHSSGWVGPAFESQGMIVWGFTAGVLSALLDMGGWSRPWSRSRVAELDSALRPVLRPADRTPPPDDPRVLAAATTTDAPAATPPADDVSGPLG